MIKLYYFTCSMCIVTNEVTQGHSRYNALPKSVATFPLEPFVALGRDNIKLIKYALQSQTLLYSKTPQSHN